MTVAESVYAPSLTPEFTPELIETKPERVAVVKTTVQTGIQAVDQLIYVKVVRSFALLVIVTLHVAFPLIYLYQQIDYAHWWIANNFYIWGKIGSPLFTMVSGLLLLNPGKDQPIALFFQKRLFKVLLPFLAWSVIYLLWRIGLRGEIFTWQQIVTLFVQRPVYYHLWFIQMILGLYLAVPILRIYTRHAPRENLTYFLLVWLITVAILPMTKRFFDFEVGIDIVVTTGFVGFFILGHYLRDVTLTRRQVIPVLLLVVAMLLFTQTITHTLTVQTEGGYDNFFVANDSLNLIVVAVGLFLFLKSLDYDYLFQRLPLLQKVVMWVSSCSLGIYFVHVLLIEELASGRLGFKLAAASFYPLLSIPTIALLVMALSVGITLVLKQIPVVRAIVP